MEQPKNLPSAWLKNHTSCYYTQPWQQGWQFSASLTQLLVLFPIIKFGAVRIVKWSTKFDGHGSIIKMYINKYAHTKNTLVISGIQSQVNNWCRVKHHYLGCHVIFKWVSAQLNILLKVLFTVISTLNSRNTDFHIVICILQWHLVLLQGFLPNMYSLSLIRSFPWHCQEKYTQVITMMMMMMMLVCEYKMWWSRRILW